MAALTGENVPERASDAYLSSTFDGFASSFDEVLLHRLDYRARSLIEASVAAVLGAREPTRDLLDAGCGTGLCGPLLAPYPRTLSGVDLSAGMLERARALAVYDRLVQDEITRFLLNEREAFDVIASADTLCYFGSLDAVARAARSALRPGGWLVFRSSKPKSRLPTGSIRTGGTAIRGAIWRASWRRLGSRISTSRPPYFAWSSERRLRVGSSAPVES